LSFLKLRHSFLKPDWAPPARQGSDEGVRQLMGENRAKPVRDAGQSSGWNANFAVEYRACPTGRLRNVEVNLIRIKNHRHCRRCQRRQIAAEMVVQVFKRLQDFWPPPPLRWFVVVSQTDVR